jgi:hypothetical protein
MPIEILYVVGAAGFVLTARFVVSIVGALWVSIAVSLTAQNSARFFFQSIHQYFKSNWTIIAFGVEGAIMLFLSILIATTK